MPEKFDVNNKPLHKAKPCITQLIRDDGSTEWFEKCKAGQLLEIKTGNQKAYINLDYNKLMNFNVRTDETEIELAEKTITQLKKDKVEYNKEVEKETIKLSEELAKLKNISDSQGVPTVKGKAKVDKLQSSYDKKIESLTGKYVHLLKNKQKNFGTTTKPILGFVCYEKEFNALPYKAQHDSKSITQWMDDILKNKKDFMAQRMEGMGKLALYILLGGAVAAFVFFRWGAPAIEKMNAADTTTTVATISMFLPYYSKRGYSWLKEKLKRNR